MFKYFFLFIYCFAIRILPSFAQVPPLPALQIETENAQNKIIWNLQYDAIKSLTIQRSADSVKNFAMIGIIKNPKKGIGNYIDIHPMVGKNYYRVSIEFTGGNDWSSNVYKVIRDSATIAKSLASKINTGSTNSKTNGILESKSTPTENIAFYYTHSTHIYTNSYTGHINITLDDAPNKRYQVRFLDPSKVEVLKIGRITKQHLVLDKNNFNNKGTYKFELYNGNDLVETGFVTIY